MKKKLLLLLVLIVCCCTACNGTVTRDIRHAGFNVGSTFECSAFYPEDKDDVSYSRIKYFTATHVITSEGELYEHSLNQKYTNGQNCKKADTNIKVKAIFDDKIIKGVDNCYYYLVSQNDAMMYDAISTDNRDYPIYDLLLGESDVIKVVTANSNSGVYYVLKDDGNVYSYTIKKENGRDTVHTITSTQVVFNKIDFGGNIIDFNYAGNSLNTFIKTESAVYRMRAKNADECTKYADVACQYEMVQDLIFEQYADRIIAYNGSLLITDYKQIFNVAN